MKKIYFIASLFALILFSACEDFNATNFPGYDDLATPANLATYNYELTSADYSTIATLARKSVTDSVTLKRNELKLAKTAADSAAINAEITRLNLRLSTEPYFVNAAFIGTNKYFTPLIKAKDYLPAFLDQKYLFADKNSSVQLIYDYVDGNEIDTIALPATSKYTLTDDDYVMMGVAAGQPGQYKNFSSTMPIMTYLNTYLKLKNPYVVANEVRMVRYKFFISPNTLVQYRVLTFDGKDWKGYKDQYIFTGTKWLFDPTIYIVQTSRDRTSPKDADGLMTDMSNMFVVIVKHVWDNPDLRKYVSSFKNDEYYYGASAYQGNYSFQYSTRQGSPYFDPELIALTTEEAKINLMWERLYESLVIYLKYAYPDARPLTADGLEQFYEITFRVYERYAATTTTNTYRVRMQCTAPGEFTFVRRVKL